MKGKQLLIWSLLLAPLFALSQPAEKACFSVPGGFYEESPVLELFPFYPQHHIRFTTNGNRPTAQSRLYTEPLLLDESLYSTSDIYTIQVAPDGQMFYPDSIQHCIVIRAAVFDEDENCISEVASNSYFIHSLGCDTHGLPTVSLCADSLDLFDYEHGIFVPGVYWDSLNADWTGNYYQSGEEWEKVINFEFYELNNEGVNQQAGLRTHGGNGRRFQQKCMKVYAREEYGNKRFKHKFFETIPNDSFKHLVLKPFVASWNQTGVNDHISNQIASQLNLESLASRPMVLYLNGEYWGIYYIHERHDERYLEDHFGVDLDQVNLLSGWGNVVCGTSAGFDSLFIWLSDVDLTNQEHYDAFLSKIDLDNFIDYQILELFLENGDWPGNNVRCWQVGDSPWRWIFYDGDACLIWNSFNAFDNAVYEGDSYWPSSRKATLFFRKLFVNEDFKQRFKVRFCELLGTSFSYSVTGPMFANIKNTLEPEIPFQSDRFGLPDCIETWNTNMGHTQWFLMKRCESILPVLERFMYWNLPEEQKTPFCVFPNPSVGPITLKINVEHQETTPCFVYDMTGRLICVKSLSLYAGYNTVTLDLLLCPGLYFLKVKDKVTKIIRQ